MKEQTANAIDGFARAAYRILAELSPDDRNTKELADAVTELTNSLAEEDLTN